MAVRYEVDITVGLFWHTYAKILVYMPVWHNGCVAHICNVAVTFVQ